MATHAAHLLGHEVMVVSKKRKSEMYGAQYLHMPIPGMTENLGKDVDYILKGTAEEYRKKVYGNNPDFRRGMKVSPEDLETRHTAWDIRRTYDNLWDAYVDAVSDHDVNSDTVPYLLEALKPDVTFSTVPAHLLCFDLGVHHFTYEEVYAIGDAPERGVFCPVSVEPQTIVCNGESSPAWYRAANVFNRKTAEWPVNHKPPINDVSLIQKPLHTDCSCFPDVVRLGRYGKWQKGALSHEAFITARDFLLRQGHQQVLFP